MTFQAECPGEAKAAVRRGKPLPTKPLVSRAAVTKRLAVAEGPIIRRIDRRRLPGRNKGPSWQRMLVEVDGGRSPAPLVAKGSGVGMGGSRSDRNHV